MSITREQAEKLTNLYEARQRVQRAKEISADLNFWLGIANDAFGGTGTRSTVLNQLGGSGEYASLMLRTVPSRFEEMMRQMDAEIERNGGTP